MFAADHGLGEALGKLYVQRAFPASSKAQVLAMVENLRSALKARIELDEGREIHIALGASPPVGGGCPRAIGWTSGPARPIPVARSPSRQNPCVPGAGGPVAGSSARTAADRRTETRNLVRRARDRSERRVGGRVDVEQRQRRHQPGHRPLRVQRYLGAL